MCEPLMPMSELKSLSFALASLVELHQRGSFEREICENATRGIKARIKWVIQQLEAAEEGQKHFDLK